MEINILQRQKKICDYIDNTLSTTSCLVNIFKAIYFSKEPVVTTFQVKEWDFNDFSLIRTMRKSFIDMIPYDTPFIWNRIAILLRMLFYDKYIASNVINMYDIQRIEGGLFNDHMFTMKRSKA